MQWLKAPLNKKNYTVCCTKLDQGRSRISKNHNLPRFEGKLGSHFLCSQKPRISLAVVSKTSLQVFIERKFHRPHKKIQLKHDWSKLSITPKKVFHSRPSQPSRHPQSEKHPTHWPHRPSREAWRESQLLPRQRITAPYRFARSKPQGSIGSHP